MFLIYYIDQSILIYTIYFFNRVTYLKYIRHKCSAHINDKIYIVLTFTDIIIEILKLNIYCLVHKNVIYGTEEIVQWIR